MSTRSLSQSFNVKVAYQGKTETLTNVTSSTTVADIDAQVRQRFSLESSDTTSIKLLYKGKVIGSTGSSASQANFAFPAGVKGTPKIMVMATANQTVTKINALKSDPTIRGFDSVQKKTDEKARRFWWGPQTSQNKEYKFCRIEACTWQSFGHRAGSRTPHAFRAMELLERLSTDPGVVAIMVERELVVGTLGEMDPIDDRMMRKTQAQGACLLGYNTNAGTRIDLKLRTNDLNDFRPYEELVATLIHELSHNWVGEHNALFWSNYGQMRVEYLHRHASLAAGGYYVDGRTSAELAGVAAMCGNMTLEHICKSVIAELASEVKQHGVPIDMVSPAVVQRCKELAIDGQGSEKGQKLGSNEALAEISGNTRETASSRELVRAAAERRARENEKDANKREMS